MGCTCSRSLHDVDSGVVDIRARYSLDATRQPADALLGHIRAHSSRSATQAAAGQHGVSRSSSAGGGTLSSSQWKQVRTLARSNTNPHYQQIQQLQLLPSNSQEQQQRTQLRTTLAAAGGQHAATAAVTAAPYLQQHRSHHPHHHIHHYNYSGLQTIMMDPRPYDTPAHLSSSIASSTGSSITGSSKAHADALLPEQVLALCGAVIEEQPALAAAGIQPLLLAAVCLIESGGRAHAKQYRDNVGDVALGLCQVLLSTAQWLASSKGFDRYGPSPTAADLEQPKVCIYFCAAYLSILAQHDGSHRSENFIVKAYHAGPKGMDSAAAGSYWHKYLKAKHCLRGVVKAMAVTMAAAAAAAGLPLLVPAAAAAAGGAMAAGSTVHPNNSSCSIGKVSQESSSDSSSTVGGSSRQQLWVWVRAAKLIAALSSSWDQGCDAEAAAAAAAAEAGGSSSFITHLLPSGLWSSGTSKGKIQQQQQQPPQQQQQEPAGTGLLRRWRSSSVTGTPSNCGSTSSRACRSSSSNNNTAAAGASSSAGALALAPVARVAFDAALLRLSCIDCATTYTCLSNAAAAAAAASSRLRSPSFSSSSSMRGPAGTAAAAAAANQAKSKAAGTATSSDSSDALLAAMPCVMHVVGHGETLAHIAAICGIAVPDILAANPDLKDGTAVQANDCIALPVPVIPPRLHVVQAGDTLHSIAKAYRVPLGRLVAKNPEIADPTRVQPGWVLVLPGLKGDSKSGLSLEWLAEAAAAEEQQGLAAAGRPGFSHIIASSNRRGSSSWQQQDVDGQHKRYGPDQDAASGFCSSVGSGSTPAGSAATAAADVQRWVANDDSRCAAAVAVGGDQTGTAGCSPGINATAAVAPAAAEAASSLPSVGSGIFLFTVGQSCSYSSAGSQSKGHLLQRQQQKQQGKHGSGSGSSKARLRGKVWPAGSNAAAAAQQLEAAAAAGAAAVVSRG